MAKRNNIPENDKDLLLAKNLGEVLENRSAFDNLDDELISKLSDFKKSELGVISLYNLSDKLWNSIDTSVSRQKNRRVLQFNSASAVRWAVAAAVLVAAFIGFYWFTLPVSPTLLAQSDSSIKTVTLDDGSEITLRPHSELYEIAFNEEERNFMLTGEGFFDVAEDAGRPFSVEAGETSITVLGTRFNLSTWNSVPTIYLEEGSVRFSSGSESVILEPGQTSKFIDGNLTQALNTQSDQYTDWMSGYIVFDNTSPEDIIAELSQHYDILISISDLEDRSPVSGSLTLGSASQTLQDLGTVLGGTFRKETVNSFTFVPQN